MAHFDKKGFTLVEILVVVAIMAVLAAVAVPGFNTWILSMHSKEAAFGIASQLKLARQTAITNNRESRTEIDVAGKRYRLTRGNLNSGSTAWTEVKPWTAIPSDMNLTTGTGLACTGTADINIRFSPRGSADQASVCVNDSGGATRFTVHVSPTNGRVYID